MASLFPRKQPIRSLPPHPDVRSALDQLKQAGFRIVTLTNSSQAGVDAQIKNAELLDMSASNRH
jgi:2-haloacid dehalogenase